MATPNAYPLAWPAHRPRTPGAKRRRPTFTHNGKPVPRGEAAARIEDEVLRMGGHYLVISTNVQMTLSGRPHGGLAEPGDPGVCVYFTMKGKPYAMACDTFNTLAGNLGAIAAHIKASRAVESYGVASTAETLQAFEALPPPAAERPKRHWSDVFGVMPERCNASDIRALFKVKAMTAHPDRGGSAEAMSELNVALTEALKEIA